MSLYVSRHRVEMESADFLLSLLLLLSLSGEPFCTGRIASRRSRILHFFQRRFQRLPWQDRASRPASRSAATLRCTGCASLRRPSASATRRVESTATVAKTSMTSVRQVMTATAAEHEKVLCAVLSSHYASCAARLCCIEHAYRKRCLGV